MSDDATETLSGVTRLFINMGAEPKPAEVMARQLIKRAHQIADERGITLVEATQHLLKQVLEARQGD